MWVRTELDMSEWVTNVSIYSLFYFEPDNFDDMFGYLTLLAPHKIIIFIQMSPESCQSAMEMWYFLCGLKFMWLFLLMNVTKRVTYRPTASLHLHNLFYLWTSTGWGVVNKLFRMITSWVRALLWHFWDGKPTI